MSLKSRLGKPDTAADIELKARLAAPEHRSFIMVAGAGSGKTTSLIKALNHIATAHGASLKQGGQQVACITYTDVAVGEISADVGHDPLFHVSTIHSFLWALIKPFQQDLKAWVSTQLATKIESAQAKIDAPRTRAATKDKERANIERYRRQLEQINEVPRFRYGTGSDYEKGVLGHSDILQIGPAFVREHELMRRVVAQRFPFIFVDESQDTDPNFVAALESISSDAPSSFCLGYFGDPIQKIYMTGIGEIDAGEHWRTITKPENFRCPTKVLNVINNIRSEADGLKQTRGRHEVRNGVETPVTGTARIFVVPADEQRTERLAQIRATLAQWNDDPLWEDDGTESDVKVLVTVHRIAATRLGFPNIYSALNDKSPPDLKEGVNDGTAWILKPFLGYLLPLLTAHSSGQDFEVMRKLRSNCPSLMEDDAAVAISDELNRLRTALDELTEIARPENQKTIGDLLHSAHQSRLFGFDERFAEALENYRAGLATDPKTPENAPTRFLSASIEELWGYRNYIEELSPFATQQGIKGAEFERVLVVLDDEENTNNSFSYGKYLGYLPLSETDLERRENGDESVIERTMRLFYVCCSRATKDLAVVIFTNQIQVVTDAIYQKGFFEPDDVHILPE